MKLTLEEIREALSDDNFYYTWNELKRPPTPMECVMHYIQSKPWKFPPHQFVVDNPLPLFDKGA